MMALGRPPARPPAPARPADVRARSMSGAPRARPPALVALVALAALVGSAGCAAPRLPIPSDGELRAAGAWTEADAAARALVGPRSPIRRATWTDLALRRRVDLGFAEVTIPWPAAPVELALGLAYEPRYVYAKGADAYVVLRRGAPAAVVGGRGPAVVDAVPGDHLPASIFWSLRDDLGRELGALLGPPEPDLDLDVAP